MQLLLHFLYYLMGCIPSAPARHPKPRRSKQHDAKNTCATPIAGANNSPIYASLPPGAEKHTVRNVYDGDTLTLIDERRVRFLGIDTPELKEKQPFAQEAKQYTYRLCHKKSIWISFGPGERQDHYGRLLAFIWVEENGGYLNVNEGIVAAGLANVYSPGNARRLDNWKKLIALQKEARQARKGMWSTFRDYGVVKTNNGAAFHRKDCKYLVRSKNLANLKASEAMDTGLHPCRSCLGDN